MQRRMFLGKIHRCRVTHADLEYEGSVTIDSDLLDAAGILEHEEVHIWNVTRGTRLATYALRGPSGSKVVCINGGAAHLMKVDDIVVIATFGNLNEEEVAVHQPKVVLCNSSNDIVEIGPERPGPQMPRHLGPVTSAAAE